MLQSRSTLGARQGCVSCRATHVTAARVRLISRPRHNARSQVRIVCFREQEGAKEQGQSSAQETTSTARGILAAPGTQSFAYNSLAVVTFATAAFAIAAPSVFASFIFGAATDPVIDTLVRATGATLITTATSKYTLKEASARQLTAVDVYRRLNLALILQSAASLVVLLQGYSVRTAALSGFLGSVCGVGLLVSARVFALSREGAALPEVGKLLGSMPSLLLPARLSAAPFAVLSVVLLAMGAGIASVSPGANSLLFDAVHSPISVFMSRVTGAGLLLCAVVALCLKDAAERELLSRNTFRILGAGLAATLLAHAVNLGVALNTGVTVQTPVSLTMLGVQVAGAAWCAYNVAANQAPTGDDTAK